MKHVKLFETFINEAARLRGPRDFKNDIADELGFDGNTFTDDHDDGYFEVEYDGDTGFDVIVYNDRDKVIARDEFDAYGMGSSEIEEEMWAMVSNLTESKKR